ncbi:MAG: arsenosugar biosynthesis-associated peroxidase-like protein [Burkholderiales bacterium]
MADDYYDRDDLARFSEIGKNSPDLAAKFFDWYGAVFADGALSAREKSIIALAVAHAVQCPYCIDAYSRDALEKGADRQRGAGVYEKSIAALRRLNAVGYGNGASELRLVLVTNPVGA